MKGTITSQQGLHLLRNIIPLNPRSRESGQNNFSGAVQAYIRRMSSWTFRLMYLVTLSCKTDFQSASAMDSAGLLDRLTSIPSIISCGPSSDSSISKQLAACSKKKFRLFLKSSRVKSCVAQMTTSWFACNNYTRSKVLKFKKCYMKNHMQKCSL